MQLKLKLVKNIGSVFAAKVELGFATDHINLLKYSLVNLRLQKIKLFMCAVALKPRTALFVMGHINPCNAPISCFETAPVAHSQFDWCSNKPQNDLVRPCQSVKRQALPQSSRNA